jgi:hypothetical protein
VRVVFLFYIVLRYERKKKFPTHLPYFFKRPEPHNIYFTVFGHISWMRKKYQQNGQLMGYLSTAVSFEKSIEKWSQFGQVNVFVFGQVGGKVNEEPCRYP